MSNTNAIPTTKEEPLIEEHTAFDIEFSLSPEFVEEKDRNCWSPLADLLVEPLWPRAKAISILASLYPLENSSSNELVWLVERPSVWARLSSAQTWRRARWHFDIIDTRLRDLKFPTTPKLWIFAARDAGITPYWWSDLVELENKSSAQKAELSRLRTLLPIFETLAEKNRFAVKSKQKKSNKEYVARTKIETEVREAWESWCLGERSFNSKESFIDWFCPNEDETTNSKRTLRIRDNLDPKEINDSDIQIGEIAKRRKRIEYWLAHWEEESYVAYGIINEPGNLPRRGYGHPSYVVPVERWKEVQAGQFTFGWVNDLGWIIAALPRRMFGKDGPLTQGSLRNKETIQNVEELLAKAAERRR